MNKSPTKRQRLFRNSIYGVISWLFPILPTLIVTPIVIKSLGNDLFGIYVIVLGFTSYFFTLNVGKAAAKYVAEYRASGQTDKISDSISATLIFGLAVGSFTTLTLALFAEYFVTRVLQIPRELQNPAVNALYLGCLNILVNMIGFTFQAILQGLQRFGTFTLVTNTTSLLLALGMLVAVFNGYGVIGLFSASLAVSSVSAIVTAVLVKRLLPELKLSFRIGSESWSEVWRYGASIMAYQLFGSIMLLFERAWITRQFGTEALTFYVVPMTLALYLPAFISSLALALFPVINENLSRKDIVTNLYQQATRVILMMLSFAVATAAGIGQVFLGLWLNGEFAERSFEILLIQVFIFSLVALTVILWQVAEAFRAAQLTASANFIWMAVSIPAMILFSFNLGLEGVAYGRMAGVLIYIPLIFYIEKRFLGGVFWNLWASVGSRLAVAALVTGGVEYLVLSQFSPSWLALCISIAAGGSIFLGLLYVFQLVGTEDRTMLKDAFYARR